MPDLIRVLRELPGARAVFGLLAGEPGVHAVGGAVRDALLGRAPREVDLVVEGDATSVARRVGERLGARVRIHERFKTATLEVGGAQFDFASARRETYPRPGALPEVELGATLAEDLERRDFTINAIAVALAGGGLTAHRDALADLDARRLRVLHERSFHDDPTRLIRLCRYGARLGMGIEESTRALADAALAAGALDTVSGERVGRELRLAAAEPQPETFAMLVRTGVAGRILGPPASDAATLADALARCPPDARRDLLTIAAACPEASPEETAARLRRLAFTREEADRIARTAGAAPKLARVLGGLAGAAASDVVAALDGAPVEAVALAAARSGSPSAAEVAQRFLSELRHVRPAVSGDDLLRAGVRGPAVGRGLAAARAMALDRPGAGREDQLEAAIGAARDAQPPGPDRLGA